MKIHVYCKGHNGSRVRLLEGTTAYWYRNSEGQEIVVREQSDMANMIHLDEGNFYCDGDITKAGHEFGYYITV